jgi:hypothetical protein
MDGAAGSRVARTMAAALVQASRDASAQLSRRAASTTRSAGPSHAISQQWRNLTERRSCWRKTIGAIAQPILRGVKRLGFKFTLAMAAYDLCPALRVTVDRWRPFERR